MIQDWTCREQTLLTGGKICIWTSPKQEIWMWKSEKLYRGLVIKHIPAFVLHKRKEGKLSDDSFCCCVGMHGLVPKKKKIIVQLNWNMKSVQRGHV